MIGTSLGPYKIIEQLGAGGMGEVYLGEDTRLGHWRFKMSRTRRILFFALPALFIWSACPQQSESEPEVRRADAPGENRGFVLTWGLLRLAEANRVTGQWLSGKSRIHGSKDHADIGKIVADIGKIVEVIIRVWIKNDDIRKFARFNPLVDDAQQAVVVPRWGMTGLDDEIRQLW